MSETHHALDGLQHADGQMLLGGKPLREVVELAGGTPCYVYDRARISARIESLRDALPATLKLHYALKANPMPALVDTMAGLVDGFDVASAGELQLALATGMNAEAISFAGPGKTDAELQAAVAAGIVIAVESEGEFRRLVSIARQSGSTRTPVILRVNPSFSLKRSGLAMGGLPSPFGMDPALALNLLRQLPAEPVDVLGFQVFAGSQNLNADSIIACQAQTLLLAIELAAHLPAPLRYLNLGGGFGIPYFAGETPLDIASVGRALDARLREHGGVLGDAELVLELGRYLVGEAGYYVTRILDIKESQGRLFAIADGGLHHHLANSGNLGQVLRKNYPLVAGTRIGQPAAGPITIAGPLCTPLDIVGAELSMPKLEVGDLIVVLQSGAYGRSASPLEFLGHAPPVELLV